MQLKSVLKENEKARFNGCFIVFRSMGSCYLSRQLGDEMQLKDGDFIDVLQDETKPTDYYLKKAKTGLKIKCYSGVKTGVYQFHARSLARKFGREFGVDCKSIKIKVGVKETHNNINYYPLITMGLTKFKIQ